MKVILVTFLLSFIYFTLIFFSFFLSAPPSTLFFTCLNTCHVYTSLCFLVSVPSSYTKYSNTTHPLSFLFSTFPFKHNIVLHQLSPNLPSMPLRVEILLYILFSERLDVSSLLLIQITVMHLPALRLPSILFAC